MAKEKERERSGITDPRGSLEFFLNVVQCSWPSTSVFHWEIPSAPVRIGACRLMDQHPHQIASCMRTTPVFMWHFRFDVSLLIMDNWWQLMIWGILGYHGYPYFRKPPLRINIGLIEFGIGLFLSEYGGFCSLPLSGCSVEIFRVAGVAATARQGHSHQGYWYNRKPWWNPKQWGYLKSRGARVYNRSDFVAFYSNPPKIVKSCNSIKLLLRWSLTVKNHLS